MPSELLGEAERGTGIPRWTETLRAEVSHVTFPSWARRVRGGGGLIG